MLLKRVCSDWLKLKIMESVQYAIFEIVALLIVIPLSYILAYLVKRFTADTYEDELLKLFGLYWNGEPEDEIYAWMKVRMILMNREENKKKVRYVNQKIERINKQSLYGTWEVTSKGELLSDEHLKK